MNILIILLYVVEVAVCLLLIGAILLQRTRGSGMGLSIGSGVGEAVFGAQAGNVLTKASVVLGIVFLVNTVVLSLLVGQRAGGRSLMSGSDGTPTSSAPAAPVPGGSESPAQP
jgi:preprotein translocase subunit SecG